MHGLKGDQLRTLLDPEVHEVVIELLDGPVVPAEKLVTEVTEYLAMLETEKVVTAVETLIGSGRAENRS